MDAFNIKKNKIQRTGIFLGFNMEKQDYQATTRNILMMSVGRKPEWGE